MQFFIYCVIRKKTARHVGVILMLYVRLCSIHWIDIGFCTIINFDETVVALNKMPRFILYTILSQ